MARSLIKHMAWLAAASLLGAAARHLWGRRLGGPERRRDLRGAVKRIAQPRFTPVRLNWA